MQEQQSKCCDNKFNPTLKKKKSTIMLGVMKLRTVNRLKLKLVEITACSLCCLLMLIKLIYALSNFTHQRKLEIRVSKESCKLVHF